MYGPRVDSLNQIRHIGPATENRSPNLMELPTTGLRLLYSGRRLLKHSPKQTCKNQFMTHPKLTTSPLKIEGAKGTPRFLGYRLVGGYPKFRYSQGKHMITELIQMNDKKTGIRRTFTISPPSKTVLKLSPTTLASTSSDRGIMKKDGTLNLSSSESAEFSVFIIPNEETN